jgi:cell wall-active antibiotic response 4TMS protein YvqF
MDADRNWGPLTGGIILMLLGGLFLAVRLGWLSEWPWHYSWWALIVIGMGLAMLIRPRRAREVGNGVMFVLLGGWFVLANAGLYGFNWHNSWPLALVAVGAGTVAKALAARWLPDTRRVPGEEHHA